MCAKSLFTASCLLVTILLGIGRGVEGGAARTVVIITEKDLLETAEALRAELAKRGLAVGMIIQVPGPDTVGQIREIARRIQAEGNIPVLVLSVRTAVALDRLLRQLTEPLLLLGLTGHPRNLAVLHLAAVAEPPEVPQGAILDLATGAALLRKLKPGLLREKSERSPMESTLKAFGLECEDVGCVSFARPEDLVDALIGGRIRSFAIVRPYCHWMASSAAKRLGKRFHLIGFKPTDIRQIAALLEDPYWPTYIAVFLDPNLCFGSTPPSIPLEKPRWSVATPASIATIGRDAITPEDAERIAIAGIAVLESKEGLVSLKDSGILEALLELDRLITVHPSSINATAQMVRSRR